MPASRPAIRPGDPGPRDLRQRLRASPRSRPPSRAKVGIKGALPDNTLRSSLDAYWSRTKDLQLTAVGGATNSANLFLTPTTRSATASRPRSRRGRRRELTLTAGGSYNFTEIRDPIPSASARAAALRCTVIDPITPAGTRDHRRQPRPAPGAALGRQRHRALRRAGVARRRALRLYRLGLSQQHQLFPLRGRGIPRASLLEGGLKVGYEADDRLGSRPVRAQHHQPDPQHQRDRLQQPHRHDQRTAHRRRAGQVQL